MALKILNLKHLILFSNEDAKSALNNHIYFCYETLHVSHL